MTMMPPSGRRRRFTLRQIFAMPLALAVISSVGLVAALVGGDAWHLFAWSAVALPLVVCGVCILRRRN